MAKKPKDEPGQLFLSLKGRATAAEEAVPVTPVRKGDMFLVDGTNVMKAADHTARLEVILTLLVELKKAEADFCCIFDANTYFEVAKASGARAGKAYERLLRVFPKHFIMSTGGLPADELLLQRADKLKQRIITNDRFSNFRDQYIWLKDERKHLIKFAVVADELQVPCLKIFAKWDQTYSQLGKELIALAGKT